MLASTNYVRSLNTDIVCQIVTGDLVEMQMHMNALERMVELRGGLHTLGMDGILQIVVKWSSNLIVLLQDSF